MPDQTGSQDGQDQNIQDTTVTGALEQTTSELDVVAALSGTTFAKVAPKTVIPKTWKERAIKATDYYLEEPLVSNGINAWRIFAVGEDIKIIADDPEVQKEVDEMVDRLDVNNFIRDMIL